MPYLSDEAIARTLSIPERNQLRIPPKASGVDLLLPTFRKLSVYKRKAYPLDESLAPLCTVEQLTALSHEETSALTRRLSADETPRWTEKFGHWMEESAGQAGSSGHGFLNLIENLVEAAVQDLETSLRMQYPGQANRFTALLVDSLPTETLTEIVVPTALLVYRRDYSGDTLEEFSHRMNRSDLRISIFEEFPVLARIVTEVLDDWLNSTIQLVDRIVNDKELLLSTFSFDVDKISRVRANLGDRHKNGATVTILEAGAQKIVYKPRAGFGEKLIASVCDLLPELSAYLPYNPVILERENYLWEEHVSAEDFSPDRAPKIAKELGALNAILYFLMADDMHHENVQISREGVAVLDAECVLNVLRPIDFMTVDVENVGARVLADAAYTVGIVPQPVNSKDSGGNPLDISVIGYKPGGVIALNVPRLDKTPAGELTLVNGPAEFNEKDPISHRSSLLQCGADFIAGFKAASDTLICHRHEILQLIDSLPEIFVRVLPRPTMIYSKILLESYHPTFMRDAALRDACLCKLLPRFYGRSYRNSLISSEMDALRNARIPYTELDLKRNELRIEKRDIPVCDDFLGRLYSHIEKIDEDEVARQCCYLDMAFASSVLKSSLSPDGQAFCDPVELMRVCDAEYKDSADLQGRLEALIMEGIARTKSFMIRSHGEVGFATMNALTRDCWAMGPAGMDLYNGLAGVHLMFERICGTSFGDECQDLYHEIMSTCLRFGDAVSLDDASIKKNVESLNVGFFDQLSGIAISQYLSLSNAKQHSRALASLKRTISMLAEMVAHDNNYDVISGSAGAIFLACMVFNEENDFLDDVALRNRLVKRSIDRLLDTVEQTGDGAFWPTTDNPSGLTGLSHGSVGIAAALALGSTEAGYRVEDCVKAVSAALTWERAHFDDVTGWADLRGEVQDGDPSESLQAWCHGSGGAYIARRIIRDKMSTFFTNDELMILDSEMHYSVAKLSVKIRDMLVSGASDCLCHGTVGNLLVLQRAVKTGEYNAGEFNSLLSAVLTRAECEGWRLGGLPGLQSASFMMGTPGIVWGLSLLHSSDTEALNPLYLGV